MPKTLPKKNLSTFYMRLASSFQKEIKEKVLSVIMIPKIIFRVLLNQIVLTNHIVPSQAPIAQVSILATKNPKEFNGNAANDTSNLSIPK